MPRQPPLCRVGRDRTTGLGSDVRYEGAAEQSAVHLGDCLASGVLCRFRTLRGGWAQNGQQLAPAGPRGTRTSIMGWRESTESTAPRTTYRGRLRSPCRVSPGGCRAPHGAFSGSDQRKHDRPPFGVSSKGEPHEESAGHWSAPPPQHRGHTACLQFAACVRVPRAGRHERQWSGRCGARPWGHDAVRGSNYRQGSSQTVENVNPTGVTPGQSRVPGHTPASGGECAVRIPGKTIVHMHPLVLSFRGSASSAGNQG
jgi:hypothetical protein